jgi:hypothetical protein
MTQYWSMKTFVEWWGIFQGENIVGVDQEGVDADYRSMSDVQIQNLLTIGIHRQNLPGICPVDAARRSHPNWHWINDNV